MLDKIIFWTIIYLVLLFALITNAFAKDEIFTQGEGAGEDVCIHVNGMHALCQGICQGMGGGIFTGRVFVDLNNRSMQCECERKKGK